MSKKVLITGGAGFIGLHLANKLLDEGYQVQLLDNFSRGVKDSDLKKTLARDKINFTNINLLDKNSIETLDKDFGIIFHLAAIIGVVHVLQSPFNVLYDNIRMLVNMINFSQKQENLSRFFFASTSEVYAGTLKYFDLPIPTPEDNPLAITDLSNPRTSYMLSKIYGEALCQKSGIPFTIFRPHNIYGPRMGMAHVIPEIIKKVVESDNNNIDVYSVNHKRTFCYIKDAVRMLWLLTESKHTIGETYNIGNEDEEITMGDLAYKIIGLVGKEILISPKPATIGSPERRCPKMTKLSQAVSYKKKYPLKKGLRETFNWYKTKIFSGNEVSAL